MKTATAVEKSAKSSPAGAGANEIRAHLHQMWSAVAGGWAEHAEFADTRGAAVTERMLELAALRPDDRVLELACGPGGVGLAAAQRIGPQGEVVMSDVAAEMTAIAAARASSLGLGNVSTRELDIEALDEPDGSYDVVLCREGIMLVQDPVRAAGEIRRVLRPGGRVVLTVWGPRQRNPWLGVVFDSRPFWKLSIRFGTSFAGSSAVFSMTLASKRFGAVILVADIMLCKLADIFDSKRLCKSATARGNVATL